MESNVRLNSSDISKYLSPKSGILTWPTRHAISSLTHPKMYEYFHASAESFFFLPLIRASHLVISNIKDIRERVMLPWVQCALTRDCISPIGRYFELQQPYVDTLTLVVTVCRASLNRWLVTYTVFYSN